MKNHFIYLIVIALLVFLLLNNCSGRKYDNQTNDSKIEFLNDTISYYQNELGQEVAEKVALNGNNDALELLLSKQIDSTQQLKRLVKGFKKVDASGNITQVVTIDSIFVPEYSGKPFEFDNTLSFVIGKTKGFFNSEYKIKAVNSSPMIRTVGLDTYTFKPRIKRFGIGFQVGYGIGSNFSLNPYIGIGLSYDLIRF
jgi:hypothetical protein